MILLDTNVVSESLQGPLKSRVQRWFDSQTSVDLYLCTPMLAELRYGIERLPEGSRREVLENAVREFERNVFADRILPIDRDCAYAYGRIVAQRERRGRPIGTMDALIAAVAISHNAALATRNVLDFEHLEIELINPFAPS